eukprot:TRINITY_DN14748_c0_g1_i1.p1 TRINITY_DN14748_c0_g1~~TRINITY_DN14748_c0_g1_i1.p1  ORF type:complete len:147 (-),score=40.82 TRINITY_DN14748_c0_g1_i1:40-447(-)
MASDQDSHPHIQAITSSLIPPPAGPYSQAIKVKDASLVFLSGQIGVNTSTNELESDVKSQTKRIMENIGLLLKEFGANYSNIVKTTILLADINDFSVVNEIYGSYFPKNPPARSTFAVKALPKNALIEIECIVAV